MKKQTKWIAVMSAAFVMTAVAPTFLAPVMAQSTGWVQEQDNWKFYDSDGYYLTDSWKKQDGSWFYLDEEGTLAFNRQVDEYYVGSDGKRILNQWISLPNDDSYDSTDAPEFLWYYFGKDGKYITSKFQSIADNWYYFNSEGHMATGKAEVDGATYYLGDSTDGIMKTGWIQLEDSSDDPEENTAWYYFDRSGKMVENQVDKKIDNFYYTFVNGKMQTGWYRLPVLSDDTATASEAASATPKGKADSVTGYQYYEKETGKRASGWLTIEGAPGISEEGEHFSFYFKSGKPLHAVSGIQAFSINSTKYAFNTRGEMQIGKQIITLDNGDVANSFFGADGVMKTGKQVIFNPELDQNQTWFFHTDGTKKGQGFHGIRDNTIYEYGLRKEAWTELRYAPIAFQNEQYLVNTSGTIQKASTGSKSVAKPELGAGYKDIKDANDKVWVVNTNGIIQ
ncbi:MAG: cell wall-binding protein [Hungatella sp.]